MAKKTDKQVVETEMPEFVAEVSVLSEQELNMRLAQLSKDIEAVNEAKQADEELESTKITVRELNAPYQEAKKAELAYSYMYYRATSGDANTELGSIWHCFRYFTGCYGARTVA